MTWDVGSDWMVSVNATVLLLLLLGSLVGVVGGFTALFNWALSRLERRSDQP